ncbi:MAG: type II toxin-antitoxin system Phd/YefM family antitoxin [Actinobacteria bacterium]|nr:type II toxin-antitoxin system Phd/YefM family antitoxin [Actinomycetota bacterium]
MSTVGVHEAKTNLSQLLKRVAAGEEVIITRSGEPVAKLVPWPEQPKRVFGIDEGKFEVPDDFDDPLPDELLVAFYDGPIDPHPIDPR